MQNTNVPEQPRNYNYILLNLERNGLKESCSKRVTKWIKKCERIIKKIDLCPVERRTEYSYLVERQVQEEPATEQCGEKNEKRPARENQQLELKNELSMTKAEFNTNNT